ncbi:phage shock envelope stress response protein PspM [Rhodococcus opacus]|uniref:Uncharacterized protein n=1 Tax=Rhodococcus opacus TaxID=37919 RepID=A0AAX3YQB9_RHOOP|nr:MULTISPECIES: hypothetical protein [Rhodococcus]MBA8960605.1 hypothetical protein [Rhodococcus opacus]MBP2206170.1 hypothetical protein [Rhodococcus opacus]MCZ4587181.1 hypothetical protein [Rhodococcus opacus]MDI9939392.1 hypothetical protein [Rhodococcus sp. IEGM 1351]MDX5964231.1 hypothetical protein [Rhodococcus opacus]
MSSTRRGRPGRAVRSATVVSGLAGIQGALRDAGESVADAAQKWRDPRERLLRKKRRARRRAKRYGIVSGSSATGAAGLALMAAPEWSMLMAGGGAVVFAVPAVLAVSRYRKLDAVTLPPGLPARRVLPAPSSAAREPMERLVHSERALHGILGVLSRSGTISGEDIEDTHATARSAAAALQAVALDITSMEDAAQGSRAAAAPLHRAITSAAAQLDDGVDQFEELVAAAAEVAVPGTTSAVGELAYERAELVSATEKLAGLAAALGEIDDIVRRYR